MTTKDIILILGFAAPMVTAVVCFILVMTYSGTKNDPVRNKLNRLMSGAYTCQALIWVGIILYFSNYKLFAWYDSVYIFTLLMNQVLLYHFVFTLTDTGNGRKFPIAHYLSPILIAGTLAVWSCFVPVEVMYSIVKNEGEPAPGYRAYSLLMASPLTLFAIYNVIYIWIGLRRIHLYRKVIGNYSADEERSSMQWLYQLFILIFLTLPVPLFSLMIHKWVLVKDYFTLLIVVTPILQYVIICYNMIRGNYVIITPPHEDDDPRQEEKQVPIDKQRFEKYMQLKKPYLDSKLKITDITVEMATNRSYLSAFINSEYGMNFCRYINRCRLHELDRLRTDPTHTTLSGLELVLLAGFSNYRSYMRAKKIEDKSGIVRL